MGTAATGMSSVAVQGAFLATIPTIGFAAEIAFGLPPPASLCKPGHALKPDAEHGRSNCELTNLNAPGASRNIGAGRDRPSPAVGSH